MMFFAPRRRVRTSEPAKPSCSQKKKEMLQLYRVLTSPPTDVPRFASISVPTAKQLTRPSHSLSLMWMNSPSWQTQCRPARCLIESNSPSPHGCRHVSLTFAELSLSGNFLGNRDVEALVCRLRPEMPAVPSIFPPLMCFYQLDRCKGIWGQGDGSFLDQRQDYFPVESVFPKSNFFFYCKFIFISRQIKGFSYADTYPRAKTLKVIVSLLCGGWILLSFFLPSLFLFFRQIAFDHIALREKKCMFSLISFLSI